MIRTGTARLVFVLCCLTGAYTANADDAKPAYGAMFLGTGLVSGVMELRRDDTAFRLTGGMFDIETCVSAALVRYGGSGRFTPYAGIGIWSVSLIPGLITGRLLFATLPVGIRWRTGEKSYIGIEADLHYFLAGADPNGDRVKFNNDRYFLPLPGIYYLWSL